jgi:branched-chain amino acid transport system permease protein
VSYFLHILIVIGIYLILTQSLNLLVGYTGLLSLCHGAFYGIGAYASTLLMMKAGLGFLPSLLLAMLATALLSLTISIPSLRLRGDYFVLASLGFQTITFAILYNWIGLTEGPYGISNIPRPTVFGIQVNTLASFTVLSSIAACGCSLLLRTISASPFGRVLKAIREDELATMSLGKNVIRFKVTAFAISAAFAAVAGSLFAGYMRFVDPTSFMLSESVFILSIIIIGGAGNFLGPILGTLLMIILPEALRFLAIPDSVAANIRQIIYGALIVLIMRYRPSGLFGEYRFK